MINEASEKDILIKIEKEKLLANEESNTNLDLESRSGISKKRDIFLNSNSFYSNIINKTKNQSEYINHIDTFIDSSGYTKYHFHLFLINSIIFFMIGSEFVITNLILSTLKDEWRLNEIYIQALSSSLFVGILITSILSGIINSNFGRRIPIITGCLILSLFSMFTSFANNFWVMIIIKVFVGIGIGTVIPSMTSLVTECIPNNNRSIVLNGVWGLYPLGIIYVCYISVHFIKRNIFDWRTTCFINSLTGIPVCYLVFFLDESPRYLFLRVTSNCKNDNKNDCMNFNTIDENNILIKKGFEILNKIGKSGNMKLTQEEKANIIVQLKEEKEKNLLAYEITVSAFDSNYNNNNNSLSNRNLLLEIKKNSMDNLNTFDKNKGIRKITKNKFSFRLFFTEDNKSTSICLIFLWFISSLISFGLLVVLPKQYEIILKNDKSESLKNMILTMYIFFVCPFVRGYISELSLGRRWTMVIGFSGSAIFSLICFFSESNLHVFSGFLNFFINISLGVVNVYTSEYYDTLLRSGALGMGNAFTRIGGIIAPFFSNFSEIIIYKGSFLSFTIISILGAILSFMLKESKMLKIR